MGDVFGLQKYEQGAKNLNLGLFIYYDPLPGVLLIINHVLCNFICIFILASVRSLTCSVAIFLLCYPCETLEGPILTRACIG